MGRAGLGEWVQGEGEYSQYYCDKFTQWQMITRISGVITLQGINMLNIYTVHLKLI